MITVHARMRRIGALAVLLLACGRDGAARSASGGRAQDTESAAAAALRAGRYDDAIASYQRLVAPADARPSAVRGLMRALAEVGRYDDAERAARDFAAAHAGSPEVALGLADVLLARGRRAAAESALTVAAARASDSLVAQARLAEVMFRRGQYDEARRRFDRFIDIYNARRRTLTSDELAAVAMACTYLGRDDAQLFKDALRAYDASIAADSGNLDARVRLAELFLAKYNSADAKTTVGAVLAMNPRHPRALVVAARRTAFDGEGGAAALARRALETNPHFAPAHALLASLSLDAEDYAAAATAASRAIDEDSSSTDGFAALAAARYLAGDSAAFAAVTSAAHAAGVDGADFHATLADVAARNRFYTRARDFAREATARDAKSWRAWAVLGLNELRAGDNASARRDLERSFAGDPYDVWVKNTLDLLDTFEKDFRETRSARFRFFVDGKESELLTLYAGPLAEAAYDSLVARYHYRPATPVRVEVYSSHADFSVRTVGLAGLGALGVSFGNVLAMDSPSARPEGEFNWGSTLWHEIAHAFTLGMTNHRVPRWLSEGLSVVEERRARPTWGWGMDVSPGFLLAYKAGRMPPPSRLNDAFLHPAYPQQVAHAYTEASLICEMIERDRGSAGIVAMLEGYRDGLRPEEVLRRALGMDAATFDARFDAYVKERFAAPLAAMKPSTRAVVVDAAHPVALPPLVDEGEFVRAMRDGVAAYDAGRLDEAIPKLETAKRLFPDYSGEHSAYWYLAQIAKQRGDARRSAAELAALTARDESSARANRELADLLESFGDSAGAAAALERVVYIAPFDARLHERLAVLAARLGDHPRAVRERRAIVALGPVDLAEARYQLAVALRDAGDAAAARREVLAALELAPAFEKAQTLLLALPRARD